MSGAKDSFPFTAVVGQEQAQLALLLVAVDPAIGGVLLRGDKGSAKTTLARGLAGLLAGDGGGAPFVELPIGATEDRVLGSLDLRAALADGADRFRPGLLAAAHGGVLYVDEVNLLPDHLVDVLLDVAASGVNRVERDGVSHEHPARFVLLGSMNPEEGELRPQLLDRFGLTVEVRSPTDPRLRAEAVRRRLAHDSTTEPPRATTPTTPTTPKLAPRVPDSGAFGANYGLEAGGGDAAVRQRLSAARRAALDDAVISFASRLAVEVGAESLRADLVLCRAAAALAGWEGRTATTDDDVVRVAPLALAHRSRRRPFDPPTLSPDTLDQAVDRARPSDPAGQDNGDDRSRGGHEGPAGDHDLDDGRLDERDSSTAGSAATDADDRGRDGPTDLGSGEATDPQGASQSTAGWTSDDRDSSDAGSDTPDGDRRTGDASSPSGSGRTVGGPDDRRPSDGDFRRDRGAGQHRDPEVGDRPWKDLPAEPTSASGGGWADARDNPTTRRSTTSSSGPGRTVGSRPPAIPGQPEALAVLPTVRAALQRRVDDVDAPLLQTDDLREPVRTRKRGRTVVLAVDASGSMGTHERVRAATGAVLGLLADAYLRRDQVALVAFRGEMAYEALPPTGSVELARSRLADLATGGATPLAAGIEAGLQTCRRVARTDESDPLLVLLTDGRATGEPGALDRARDAARLVAMHQVDAVVLDAEDGPAGLGLASELAQLMHASHVRLSEITATAVESTIRVHRQ